MIKHYLSLVALYNVILFHQPGDTAWWGSVVPFGVLFEFEEVVDALVEGELPVLELDTEDLLSRRGVEGSELGVDVLE